MALATRERIREIGVLKALGAPDLTVIRQFVAEAMALSLAGAVVGSALFAAGGPFIADRLLGLSSASLTGLAGGMGSQPASDVIALSVFTLYLEYGVALALVLGILGSLTLPTVQRECARQRHSAMSSMLELEDVWKEFRSGANTIAALRGVTFSIKEPGKMVVVLGRSGSGKTTLLHVVGALDRPTRGHVRLGGQGLANFEPT